MGCCFFLTTLTGGSPFKLLWSAVEFQDAVKGERNWCGSRGLWLFCSAPSAVHKGAEGKATVTPYGTCTLLTISSPQLAICPLLFSSLLLQVESWPWRAMRQCTHGSSGVRGWGTRMLGCMRPRAVALHLTSTLAVLCRWEYLVTAIALAPAKPLFPMLVRRLGSCCSSVSSDLLAASHATSPPPASSAHTQPLQTRPRDYITILLSLFSLVALPLCLLWNAACLLLWSLSLLGLRPLARRLSWQQAHCKLHGAFVKICSEWALGSSADVRRSLWGAAMLNSAYARRSPPCPYYPSAHNASTQHLSHFLDSADWLGTARYCTGENEQPEFPSGDYIASTGEVLDRAGKRPLLAVSRGGSGQPHSCCT